MADRPKLLFLIADGMGDWPVPELGGRTPMEAAATPHMDALAHACLAGTIRTVPEGMAPGSDVANMALMGFDPAAHHTGRGPIEAAAQGLALDPDDLVWRLNLVNVTDPAEGGVMLDYSSGHISTEVSAPLVKALDEHLRSVPGCQNVRLYPGVQYRHLLVQKGAAGGPDANLYVRPPHDITDQPILDDVRAMAASPALRAVYEAGAAFLAGPDNAVDGKPSGANAVWPWGQGRPLLLPAFAEQFGLTGAVISAVDLVKGLGRASNMEVVDVPGATGLLDTNYQGKVDAALAFLKGGGDFVYLHVEAPDECGHGGDPLEKTEAIARFDARIVGPVVRALPEAAVFIACDHFTPIAERTHTTDPVPFLLHAPGIADHALPAFSEANCVATGLCIEPGHLAMAEMVRRLGS